MMPPLSFKQCVSLLRKRLDAPLPGTQVQIRMAPGSRAGAEQASVVEKDCRKAGVLMLLYPNSEGKAILVLTARHDQLTNHPGQISFPGGARENRESLRGTALRESNEELALRSRDVDVLGALTPLYIPPSGFCVFPFVGIMLDAPTLQPMDAEVEEVLHVPLRDLLDPDTRRRETRRLHEQRVEVPFYAVQGRKVWGATAMMLAELLTLFRDDSTQANGAS